MSARDPWPYAETIAPEWMDFALCGEIDPELFFAEDEEGLAGEVYKAYGMTMAAKRVCAGCPVQRLCLDYAVRHRIAWGVWGGTTRTDRLRIFAALPDQCHNGHLRTEVNTHVDADGYRHCLDCDAISGKKRAA